MRTRTAGVKSCSQLLLTATWAITPALGAGSQHGSFPYTHPVQGDVMRGVLEEASASFPLILDSAHEAPNAGKIFGLLDQDFC